MDTGRSIQEALRLGKPEDIFFYTSSTTSKQAIPTIVDTKFYQSLTSLGAGSSTFIISNDQGLSDIILAVELPAQGENGTEYTGLAIPRAWLASLISRISIRYGSSSQYFWSGMQCLIENLREMPNPTTRDSMFELAGVNCIQLSDFQVLDNLQAYMYLNFPHNSPNGSMGKPNPLPTNLLNQPVVCTVEMNPLPNIFSKIAGSIGVAPSALKSAYFQVKQVHAKDTGDLMTVPGGGAYSFPTKSFYQNEIQVQLSNGGAVQPNGSVRYSTLLTGFRSGEVRSIFFWITKDSDVNGGSTANTVRNFTEFIIPRDVELLYNGTVYYRTFGTSTQMWSLISTETPPQLNNTLLSVNATPAFVSTSSLRSWCEIPFGQVFEQLSGSHMYVAGKNIQNAVINLNVAVPDGQAYTLHATYAYNCVLMIDSNKSCEYAF